MRGINADKLGHHLRWFLSTYFILQGAGLYSRSIKKVEEGIQGTLKKVNELTGNIIASIISKI